MKTKRQAWGIFYTCRLDQLHVQELSGSRSGQLLNLSAMEQGKSQTEHS